MTLFVPRVRGSFVSPYSPCSNPLLLTTHGQTTTINSTRDRSTLSIHQTTSTLGRTPPLISLPRQVIPSPLLLETLISRSFYSTPSIILYYTTLKRHETKRYEYCTAEGLDLSFVIHTHLYSSQSIKGRYDNHVLFTADPLLVPFTKSSSLV